MFMVTIEAPVGTSMPAMDRAMQEVERIVLSQPEIDRGSTAIALAEQVAFRTMPLVEEAAGLRRDVTATGVCSPTRT